MRPNRFGRSFALALLMLCGPAQFSPALGQRDTGQSEAEFEVDNLKQELRGRSLLADAAMKMCDAKGMQEDLEGLNKLAARAKKLAKTLKAAGQFATASAQSARDVADGALKKAKEVAEAIVACQRPPDAGVVQDPSKPQPPETAAQTLLRMEQEAEKLDRAHAEAARECNLPLMKQTLEQMRAIREEMDKVAKAAKDLYYPASSRIAFRVTQLIWAASDRKPENCPKTEQPQQQQQTPSKPGQQVPEKPEQQQQQEVPPKRDYGVRFVPPDRDSERFLARINYWRRDAGMTALVWDRELAGEADARALEMVGTGLVHQRRAGARRFGENILASLPGQRSPEQMIDVWGREKRYFTAGTFPNISTTGDWSAAGHYSQLVWGGSIWVGCGVQNGSGYDWTVCAFYPVGNKDGKVVLAQPPGEVEPFLPRKGVGWADGPSGPGKPVLAGDTGVAPETSTATTAKPPPPPTASDDAPGGNEDNHPLVGYGAEAFIRHSAAVDCGNQAAADAELAKLRYALDELRKRLKAAKKAGKFSAVKPEDVQRQINLLESFLKAAEQRKPGGKCPPPPPPPPPPK